MWKHAVAITLLALVMIAVGPKAASAQGAPHLFAVLSGGNEVSSAGAANAGDPDAFGAAFVLVTRLAATSRLCVSVMVHNMARPTVAHIHDAAAGVNGPIFVTIPVPTPLAAPHTATAAAFGCVEIPRATAVAIRDNANRFYINVHNAQFPGGAVRGQLF